MYAKEIEACYQEAEQTARGPQFLDCLKRRAREQEDALATVFGARMSYLEASPVTGRKVAEGSNGMGSISRCELRVHPIHRTTELCG